MDVRGNAIVRGATSRIRGRQRGATSVEFAFMFPLLFIVLMTIVLMIVGIFLYTTTAHAASEGARFAMVRGSTPGNPLGAATEADVRAFVQTRASLGASTQVSAVWEPDNNPGSTVRVTVRIPFPITIPYFTSGPLTFSSTSRGVIAH